MRFQSSKNHAIDLLFPIALFFVFTMSSLTVVLLAANIYRSTTDTSSKNYAARTSLSYISEKVRQNDTKGAVVLGSIEGVDCLLIHQEYDNQSYATYIYEHEGQLKELYVKDDIEARKSDGKVIMNVTSFTMEQLSDDLLRFTSTDNKGTRTSIIVNPKTTNE
ncbi:DUF4860 domain-containing protein [Lachnospiraceae bacterium LCP25S3_G4]